MIRINLLPDGGRVDSTPARWFLRPVTLAGVAIFGVVSVGLIWWAWSLLAGSRRLDADMAAADRELRRLTPLAEAARLGEEERVRLERELGHLNGRGQRQDRTIELLDEIGRVVPDGVWITRMSQTESALELAGRAYGFGDLTEFVTRLAASPMFLPSIQILDSRREERTRREVVRFELRAPFRDGPVPRLPGGSSGDP